MISKSGLLWNDETCGREDKALQGTQSFFVSSQAFNQPTDSVPYSTEPVVCHGAEPLHSTLLPSILKGKGVPVTN
jgi:hypothetical protein